MRRLEADIATGRLTPGERLAPERQLGVRLDVARNTLRRALADLAARGLIEARDRSGWFVNGRGVTIETISGPQGLTDWAAVHGLAVSSQVIAAKARRGATRPRPAPCGSRSEAEVFELERVRIVEGCAAVARPLDPRAAAGHDPDRASTSPPDRCTRRFASRTGSSRRGPSASCARSPPTAGRPTCSGSTEGDPLLELSETVFDQYGEPFEFGAPPQPRRSVRVPDDRVAGGVWAGPGG